MLWLFYTLVSFFLFVVCLYLFEKKKHLSLTCAQCEVERKEEQEGTRSLPP